MEWSCQTVATFFSADFSAGDNRHDPLFTATLARLMQNQTNSGNAVIPLHEQPAATQLMNLLDDHINEVAGIPVAVENGTDTSAPSSPPTRMPMPLPTAWPAPVWATKPIRKH